MKRSAIVLAVLAALAVAGALDTVKSRGAVSTASFGASAFRMRAGNGPASTSTTPGRAAAILNDPNKVKYVALAANDRLSALLAGDIDVLARNTTWSNARESQYGLLATGATYYDGQGFLVAKKLKIDSASQLGNRSIGFEQGTTSEAHRLFRLQRHEGHGRPLRASRRRHQGHGAGQCDAFTSDALTLYGARRRVGKVEDHVFLSDLISRESLSPFVRQGDHTWFNIIRWAHFVLLNAEALGIRQTTVDRDLESSNRATGGCLEAMTFPASKWD